MSGTLPLALGGRNKSPSRLKPSLLHCTTLASTAGHAPGSKSGVLRRLAPCPGLLETYSDVGRLALCPSHTQLRCLASQSSAETFGKSKGICCSLSDCRRVYVRCVPTCTLNQTSRPTSTGAPVLVGRE